MDWSFSESITFTRCPRQWYFRYRLANAKAKRVPIQREAYLLSKLDSIWAWRGKVVDHVISHYIIPALRGPRVPDPTKCLEQARRVFERQLAFGLRHGLRKPELTVSKVGEEFAAFHALEYGSGLSDQEIAHAWSDIEQAITNLFGQRELLLLLREARHLVVQRPLRYICELPVHGPVSIKGTPDLIAFYENRPPVIVDWKVRAVAATDYRIQLGIYALALIHGRPHKDFPEQLARYAPEDLELLEVQLLQDTVRVHRVGEEDVADLEEYIYDSISQIRRVLDGRPMNQLQAEDFPPAHYPEICEACNFRAICWEDPKWQDQSPTSFPSQTSVG